MNQNNSLQILYEDNQIIVAIKPFNVLSQSDCTGDKDMVTIVKEYIKEKYNKPGNVYLGLVHRLDRPVGGVMIFARTSKAASRLTDMFKKHCFTKKYLAVVYGIFDKKTGKLTDYLSKGMDGNTTISNKKNGKYSELNYKVIAEENSNNLSLLEIELLTGRHHQIRVQFASRNHCLYGDQRYGKNDNNQIALWAYYIEFIHPTKKEKVSFSCFPPQNGVWTLFDTKNINNSCK
jgi:23S rRNA pseudouridine1911/1915/1917 synthase